MRATERERLAKRKEYQQEKKAAKDAQVSRIVAIVTRYKRYCNDSTKPTSTEAEAALLANKITEDALFSHLRREQRDYIAVLIMSVELTGEPETEEYAILRNNRCFRNARDLVAADKTGRVNYVEGITTNTESKVVTYHAWNQIDGIWFDVTAVINQYVHENLDYSKEVYRGEVISCEQLAERDSQRNKAMDVWSKWMTEHKEATKSTVDDFYAVHGAALKELELSEGDIGTVWDAVLSQMEGYPSRVAGDMQDAYFTHAEALSRFGHDSETDGWITDWVNERLAQSTTENVAATCAAAA